MAVLHFDTSAIVKRYVAEAGSSWVQAVTDLRAENDLFLSALAGPELAATLVRGARDRRQLARRLPHLLSALQRDWTNLFTILNIDEWVIGEAMRLATSHRVRGANAVHLASALALEQMRRDAGFPAITFVSADQEQLNAARAEGLLTEDPIQHM